MPENTEPLNRLLAALPAHEYHRISAKLEPFDLTLREIIYNPGDPITHVYFPETGIVSLLAVVDENALIEVGIVGNEGVIGLPLFLGADASDSRALVQGAGIALRMRAADFLDECERGGELPKTMLRFIHRLMTQISQSAACNGFHTIESRMAKWLLLTADRMKTDRFKITHEFLSNMLGVRREGVSIAASGLRERRIIDYSRGDLSIIDRPELEAVACSCYDVIKKSYENL